jgi:hypothetical protein
VVESSNLNATHSKKLLKNQFSIQNRPISDLLVIALELIDQYAYTSKRLEKNNFFSNSIFGEGEVLLKLFLEMGESSFLLDIEPDKISLLCYLLPIGKNNKYPLDTLLDYLASALIYYGKIKINKNEELLNNWLVFILLNYFFPLIPEKDHLILYKWLAKTEKKFSWTATLHHLISKSEDFSTEEIEELICPFAELPIQFLMRHPNQTVNLLSFLYRFDLDKALCLHYRLNFTALHSILAKDPNTSSLLQMILKNFEVIPNPDIDKKSIAKSDPKLIQSLDPWNHLFKKIVCTLSQSKSPTSEIEKFSKIFFSSLCTLYPIFTLKNSLLPHWAHLVIEPLGEKNLISSPQYKNITKAVIKFFDRYGLISHLINNPIKERKTLFDLDQNFYAVLTPFLFSWHQENQRHRLKISPFSLTYLEALAGHPKCHFFKSLSLLHPGAHSLRLKSGSQFVSEPLDWNLTHQDLSQEEASASSRERSSKVKDQSRSIERQHLDTIRATFFSLLYEKDSNGRKSAILEELLVLAKKSKREKYHILGISLSHLDAYLSSNLPHARLNGVAELTTLLATQSPGYCLKAEASPLAHFHLILEAGLHRVEEKSTRWPLKIDFSAHINQPHRRTLSLNQAHAIVVHQLIKSLKAYLAKPPCKQEIETLRYELESLNKTPLYQEAKSSYSIFLDALILIEARSKNQKISYEVIDKIIDQLVKNWDLIARQELSHSLTELHLDLDFFFQDIQ